MLRASVVSCHTAAASCDCCAKQSAVGTLLLCDLVCWRGPRRAARGNAAANDKDQHECGPQGAGRKAMAAICPMEGHRWALMGQQEGRERAA